MIKEIFRLPNDFPSNFDITSQKKKYLNYAKQLPYFFINKSELSKQEVIELIKNNKHDNKTEFLSILFWGIYFDVITKKADLNALVEFIESNSFEDIMDDIKVTIINSESPSQLFKKFTKEFKIPGLSYAYFTKLFFFYREASNKTTYPILDKWLSNAWCALDGSINKNSEVYNKYYKGRTNPIFDGILKRNKDTAYEEYVRFMDETAKKENTTISNLEEKLFGAHLGKYQNNNPRTLYREWALKNNIRLKIIKKKKNKEDKNSTSNINSIKTEINIDTKPHFYLHTTSSYKAIRTCKETSKKIGYIKSNGYLHASEELKKLLVNQNLKWEDATRDGGSRERWKYQFSSEDEFITLLKNERFLK
jgi:hypothetical protein